MACIRRRAGFCCPLADLGGSLCRLAVGSAARFRIERTSSAAGAWEASLTPSCRTTTSCAKREGRQSKVASGCCRPWSMRMVSPGDLTCRRALGDIGQMSGMKDATTQTALPRIGAHDPNSIGHRHRSGLAAGGKSRSVGAQRVGAPGKERG
jgi:hypothetical protein